MKPQLKVMRLQLVAKNKGNSLMQAVSGDFMFQIKRPMVHHRPFSDARTGGNWRSLETQNYT
jgi:hypothetical protein